MAALRCGHGASHETGETEMLQMNAKKRPVAMRLAILMIALACVAALYAAHTGQQSPPIKLGTSGSNVKDINSSYCCTGTLGSQVKDANGVKYILSNNHVLARANAGAAGEGIMQRGYVDTVPPCTTTGTIIVAHLTKFVTLNFSGGNNTVDAAIAKVVAGQVNTNGAILQIGTISSATTTPAVGMAVEKSGRTTGLTSSTISSVNVSVTVSGYGPCGLGTKVAKFTKQFAVSSSTFSAAGDSGSLILKKPATGQKPNPVGLLFAGGTGITFANGIKNVLSALAVTFDATAPTSAELAAAADVSEPDIEAASSVKDKYDDFLFTLPEVVGDGVGRNASGQAVIQLFLRQATDIARQAAPPALDGIPVVIQETGEIRAIPNCSSCPSCKK
jgi:hypothetical protein